MEIQIQGKDRFLFVHSVIITKNQEHPKQADILWCYSCGENIARIKGKISQIRAGEIGTNEIAAIRECAKCRKNYIITAVTKLPNVIRLTLVYDPYFLPNIFRCVICRQPQFDYTPERVIILSTKRTFPLPYAFTCQRSTCGKQYLLEDVVSSTMNL